MEETDDVERQLNLEQVFRLRDRIIEREDHEYEDYLRIIPESNIFSLSSPQQFPFYKCNNRKLGQTWNFYGKVCRDATLITKTGYYEEISRKEVLNNLYHDYLVGYRRDFRFYHGSPPAGIESDWLVTEFGIYPEFFEFPDEVSSILAEDHVLWCVYQIPRIVRNDPPGYRFRHTDLELVTDYLKKYILGEYIEGDPIPTCYMYSVQYPQTLPFHLCKNAAAYEWHFFCHKKELTVKELRSFRLYPGFNHEIYRDEELFDNEDSLVAYSSLLEFSSIEFDFENPFTVKEFSINPTFFGIDIPDDISMKELVSKVVLCKVSLFSSETVSHEDSEESDGES